MNNNIIFIFVLDARLDLFCVFSYRTVHFTGVNILFSINLDGEPQIEQSVIILYQRPQVQVHTYVGDQVQVLMINQQQHLHRSQQRHRLSLVSRHHFRQ